MTDEEIVDQITTIRTRNNINWMQLLRIALKYAPEEARPVLLAIHACDEEVGDLVRMLAYPAMRAG